MGLETITDWETYYQPRWGFAQLENNSTKPITLLPWNILEVNLHRTPLARIVLDARHLNIAITRFNSPSREEIHQFPLSNDTVISIGRGIYDEPNFITIPDAPIQISRRHFTVMFADGSIQLIDHSTNHITYRITSLIKSYRQLYHMDTIDQTIFLKLSGKQQLFFGRGFGETIAALTWEHGKIYFRPLDGQSNDDGQKEIDPGSIVKLYWENGMLTTKRTFLDCCQIVYHSEHDVIEVRMLSSARIPITTNR